MVYDIEFSETALRQFKKLDKGLQKRIITTLERIRFRPGPYVTKLVGDKGYRLRVGDYRVLMDIHEDKMIILVLKVGHRKNIYKSLQRS